MIGALWQFVLNNLSTCLETLLIISQSPFRFVWIFSAVVMILRRIWFRHLNGIVVYFDIVFIHRRDGSFRSFFQTRIEEKVNFISSFQYFCWKTSIVRFRMSCKHATIRSSKFRTHAHSIGMKFETFNRT